MEGDKIAGMKTIFGFVLNDFRFSMCLKDNMQIPAVFFIHLEKDMV